MMRVLVVSEVRIVREGLSSLLACCDGVAIVGATDIEHARHDSADLAPDVVLFDAGRRDNVTRLRGLASAVPACKVVAFGVKETNEEILALAAAGTSGYVGESAASADVVQVLERVMCGELLCSPRAAASLFRQVAILSQHSPGPSRARLLSRRELQIACLIDRGLTNKQIARELGIEVATVKNHVHNMCDKLKVHRRGEAAARIRAELRAGSTASGSGAPSAASMWSEATERAP